MLERSSFSCSIHSESSVSAEPSFTRDLCSIGLKNPMGRPFFVSKIHATFSIWLRVSLSFSRNPEHSTTGLVSSKGRSQHTRQWIVMSEVCCPFRTIELSQRRQSVSPCNGVPLMTFRCRLISHHLGRSACRASPTYFIRAFPDSF